MQNFTNEKITRSAFILRDPRSVLLSEMHHYNRASQEETFKYMANYKISLGVKKRVYA